jgi:hypothetical protein
MLTLRVDLGFGRGFVTRSFPVLSDEELDARIAAYEAAEEMSQAKNTRNDSKFEVSRAAEVEIECDLFDEGYENEFEREGYEEAHCALH